MIEITDLGTAVKINSNYHNKNGLDISVAGESVAIKRFGQVLLDTTHFSLIKYGGSVLTSADGLASMASDLVQTV